MKIIIPLALIFLAINGLILAGGLSRIDSPEAKTLLAGYHAHFVAFFLLAFVMSLILLRMHVHHAYIISLGYAVGLAVALEVLQSFTGYRHFSFVDILFGGLGACLHWVIAIWLGKGVMYGTD